MTEQQYPVPATSGTVIESTRTDVSTSEAFREDVRETYGGKCILTGIEHRGLLTVSHVLDRSTHPEIAEDIENVTLLSYTHHEAFDEELWIFDEDGRVHVAPDFDTSSAFLQSSLVDLDGRRFEALSMVADEYIQEHNQTLDWWPRNDAVDN